MPVYDVEEYIQQALDSIPVRDDIELIVVDDCSEDKSLDIVLNFWIKTDLQMRVLKHTKNKGISITMNDLYDMAQGEYVYQLDPDDYLYTDKWEKVLDELDGTDLVFVDAETDTDYLDKPNEENHNRCAAWFMFIRREYLGDYRRVMNPYGGDYEMYIYLIGRPHTKKFTSICAYHYTYPRVGSMMWRLTH